MALVQVNNLLQVLEKMMIQIHIGWLQENMEQIVKEG